jgi:hypothetical protein
MPLPPHPPPPPHHHTSPRSTGPILVRSHLHGHRPSPPPKPQQLDNQRQRGNATIALVQLQRRRRRRRLFYSLIQLKQPICRLTASPPAQLHRRPPQNWKPVQQFALAFPHQNCPKHKYVSCTNDNSTTPRGPLHHFSHKPSYPTLSTYGPSSPNCRASSSTFILISFRLRRTK